MIAPLSADAMDAMPPEARLQMCESLSIKRYRWAPHACMHHHMFVRLLLAHGPSSLSEVTGWCGQGFAAIRVELGPVGCQEGQLVRQAKPAPHRIASRLVRAGILNSSLASAIVVLPKRGLPSKLGVERKLASPPPKERDLDRRGMSIAGAAQFRPLFGANPPFQAAFELHR
ncbi:uncharacterized protein PAN0_161c6823 [Moesziomyces antarcticus]|uniref:Uncharacterized protein n=2 Tax=Pseudozyma antarctica TaxID=84753 RepID=A0A5C3FTB2_PSEA2|nr:uncharacterized protein PAN0_161c6823 [Moesziomyces antarcticus]GAK68556.1 hypothetical protein PAN0_161c6823 [Moesziomyces antarcticus]SPO47390.1 uncharacterized protein PSANT_05078 [Moesziomyces antarcticus]